MTVEIIRHGQTKLQQEHCYQGITDEPLSEEGRNELVPSPDSPELVYVTGLHRTQETASLLFPQSRQKIVPGLEEMNFGDFEGKSYRMLENDADYIAWVKGNCEGRCPNGEKKEEFCRRACAAFERLLNEAEKGNRQKVILVAHGGTQMAVMERYCVEKHEFYQWHLESGMGYLLDAEAWKSQRKLKLLQITDYRRSKR